MDSTCAPQRSGRRDAALFTKSSQRGSLVSGLPTRLPGIRTVVASEVRETAPPSGCLGSRIVVSECVCVCVEEIMGISNLTLGCVPGGCKELCSTSASPFWEGEGGICVDSP